jgi:hypothetical protein
MDDEKKHSIGLLIINLTKKILDSASLTDTQYEEISSSNSYNFDNLVDGIIDSLKKNENLFVAVNYTLFESLSNKVKINIVDKKINLNVEGLKGEGLKGEGANTSCPTFKMFIFYINLIVILCNKLFKSNGLEYNVGIKSNKNVTENMQTCSISDKSLNDFLPKLVEPLPRLDVLEIPPEAEGGHKSRRRHRHRRKPARKTRRGRGRKSKAKTHRRRRHSRVRKHKKNTYTHRR